MDASAIFGMGSLVDELKNVQSNSTQKTADILDSIQRVTSKKAVLDKEGQVRTPVQETTRNDATVHVFLMMQASFFFVFMF